MARKVLRCIHCGFPVRKFKRSASALSSTIKYIHRATKSIPEYFGCSYYRPGMTTYVNPYTRYVSSSEEPPTKS